MSPTVANTIHGVIIVVTMMVSFRELDKKQYPEAFYWLAVAALVAVEGR